MRKIPLLLLFLFSLAFPLSASEPLDKDLLVRRAAYLFNKGDCQQARILLELVEAEPAYAPLRYFMLGKIYRQKDLKDEAKALTNFELALRYSTSDKLRLYSKIHIVYLSLNAGAMERAVALAEEILSQAPADPDATYCYAMAHNALGFRMMKEQDAKGEKSDDAKYLEGIGHFEKALKVRPKLYGIANNAAVCYARIAEKYCPKKPGCCENSRKGMEFLLRYPDKLMRKGTGPTTRDYLVQLCPELGVLSAPITASDVMVTPSVRGEDATPTPSP